MTYGKTKCFGRFYIHFPQGALILMNVHFLGVTSPDTHWSKVDAVYVVFQSCAVAVRSV